MDTPIKREEGKWVGLMEFNVYDEGVAADHTIPKNTLVSPLVLARGWYRRLMSTYIRSVNL
jgi:hypothetical protein